MSERSTNGESGTVGNSDSGTVGRRGFLAASAGVVALAATACSSSDKSAAASTTSSAAPTTAGGGEIAASPGVESSASKAFEVMNAGGTVGWEGIAVIGGGQSNKLFIMDAKSHKTVTAITNVGPYHPRTDPSAYPNIRDSHSIVFTKDFKRMFTATRFTYGISQVIEYDPLTLREVVRVDAGLGTHHMALSPDDKYLYAANQYGANMTIIDTKTMKNIGAIETGANPDYISQSMYWGGKVIPTDYMYVSVSGAHVLAVFNWRTNKMVKQIPLPAIAHGVNITPDGTHVWLAGQAFEEVWVIKNDPSLEIVKKLPIEGSPIHISISPDSRYAYITTSDNSIFKVDTTNYQTLWASKGTVIPAHTGLSPDGKELWTLNHGMSTSRYPFLLGGQPVEGVQIWDTNTGKLINEIPMEAMPHEIQFVPYSAFGVPTPSQDIIT